MCAGPSLAHLGPDELIIKLKKWREAKPRSLPMINRSMIMPAMQDAMIWRLEHWKGIGGRLHIQVVLGSFQIQPGIVSKSSRGLAPTAPPSPSFFPTSQNNNDDRYNACGKIRWEVGRWRWIRGILILWIMDRFALFAKCHRQEDLV